MTELPLVDPALRELANSFFAEKADAARAALHEDDRALGQVWLQAADLGLTGVGIPAAAGGSGGTLPDALTIMTGAAHAAIPLPLAENFLASWLLVRAGEQVPAAATIAIPRADDTLTLDDGDLDAKLGDVPWGSSAEALATVVADRSGAWHIVTFDPRAAVTRMRRNLAGEPTATVHFQGRPTVCTPVSRETADDYHWLGALCRAAQISGALETTARLSVAYAKARIQFGRPISSFQAVQQHLVIVAQAADAASMAASQAMRAEAIGSTRRTFEVCAAKLIANESARAGARAAHQVHGAMGMTREYPLHQFTSRLQMWRAQFGSDHRLADALGGAVAQAPTLLRAISDPTLELVVSWPM